jgi:hypothetical protein
MEVSGQPHAPAALPRGKIPSVYWIGGRMDPRADLDGVAKEKIPTPTGNRTPVVHPVA